MVLEDTDPNDHLHDHQPQRKSDQGIHEGLQQFIGPFLLCQQFFKLPLLAAWALFQEVMQQARQFWQ